MSVGQLVHKETREVVDINDTIQKEQNGVIEKYTVRGWRKPMHSASSGRVFVIGENDTFEKEFFPHVFNLEIIDYS
jgi:hypothetical protein